MSAGSRPDAGELAAAADLLRDAKAPLMIAGGGVHYSEATDALDRFATAHGIPVAETQAGKSALPHDHPCNLGAIGVTGTSAANQAAETADVILAVGTRLQDFTTGSWALFQNPARRLIGLNVQVFDAAKHHMQPLIADARVGSDGTGHRARRPPRAGCLAATPDRRRRLRGASRPPPSPRHPTQNCRRTRR